MGWGLAFLLTWPLLVWAATPTAFDAVHYDLDVHYDAATHTLQGIASCTAVWRGAQPLIDLYFFLQPNTLGRPDPREPAAFSDLRYPHGFDAAKLTVATVSDGAQHTLEFTLHDDGAVPVGHVPDQAILQVRLPRPYNAGERFQVIIAFTTRLPQAKNWGYYRGTVALDGQWYPMLVPSRQDAWMWGMQEFVRADYTLRLTAAADQQVIASVPWTSSTQQHGRQTLSGSAGPLYQLGLCLSTQWQSVEDLAHAGATVSAQGKTLPPLRVLAPADDAPEARHMLQILRRILTFYHQEFALSLHSPQFTVVVHERDLSWPFSAAADNMLLLSRDLLRVPDLVHKLSEYFVARGLAGQWWGLHTAYNLRTERWVGEGLATYMALRWLEHTYGRGRTFLSWKGTVLPNLSFWEQYIEIPYRELVRDRLDQRLTTPTDETLDRYGLRRLHEKKGALIYVMLHDLLGVQAFQHFLALLLTTEAPITSEDVRHAAEAASGRELGWFFQQWVNERVWLDYAVGQVETMQQTGTEGQPVYQNRVAIRRLGAAIMPVTVRLLARDGSVYTTELDGTAPTTVVTWQSAAPLDDVEIDPAHQLPDVQRLNNFYRVPYTIRPLIDFPRLDRYLLYPFVTLDNNFIDGYTPRLQLTALYLDEQAATVSIGHKEALDELSVEAQLLRNRFPYPGMTSSLTYNDRQGARTISLDISLLLRESHQQYLTPANYFTLGYHIAFLDRITEFNGEAVPADFAPSTGRLHSIVLRYLRDTRIPTPVGSPTSVVAEPLAYGYVLRLNAELASKGLGSTEPDFQQVQWEASDYLRLWNQTSLQLRTFGGWSAGTVPLQHKLSLAGIDAVRAYPYRLQFLGDRMLGGTVSLRFPVLPDVRADLPGRYLGLRSVHIGPFVDGGWVWNRGQSISDVSLRSGAGLRLIAGFGFGSLLRFEVVTDLAVPLDERGRREEPGLRAWVRLQSTVGGGVH
jgi:hypothetical protein